MSAALVLLSGGLDSVAALLFQYHFGPKHLAAVFFYYGQPMAAQEAASARRACEALSVPLIERDLSPVFAAFRGGLMAAPASGRDATGKDTAFLPGRNAVLMSVAASLAIQRWETGATLVVGFNAGDMAGFPDCRQEFCKNLEFTLRAGGSPILISVPWAHSTKRQIVAWVERTMPSRMPLIEQSWSCYSGQGPCGACTACVARAAAFA